MKEPTSRDGGQYKNCGKENTDKKPSNSDRNFGRSEKKRPVSFNMIHFDSSVIEDVCGKLMNIGAPYSGTGFLELYNLAQVTMPDWNRCLDPIFEVSHHIEYWQYGSDTHASGKRRLLYLTFIFFLSDDTAEVLVRHLVIDWSS